MTGFVVIASTVSLIVFATIALGVGLSMAVWREHTPASQSLADDLDAAFGEVGKRCALAVDIFGTKASVAAPRLSRAMRGEPLNLWRLSVNTELLIAFCTRVLERHGAVVFTPRQVTLLRSVDGAKTMARMGLNSTQIRREA